MLALTMSFFLINMYIFSYYYRYFIYIFCKVITFTYILILANQTLAYVDNKCMTHTHSHIHTHTYKCSTKRRFYNFPDYSSTCHLLIIRKTSRSRLRNVFSSCLSVISYYSSFIPKCT